MIFPEIASTKGRSDSGPGCSASARATPVGPTRWHQGSSSSRHRIRRQRTTTTPTRAQRLFARGEFEKLVHLVDDSWDGIITDKSTFPLSEIVALKRCSFSANFYVYARLNGRTGVIPKDLIEDILEHCITVTDVEPELEADQADRKMMRKESKGKEKANQGENSRVTAVKDTAPAIIPPDSDEGPENEILSQTFEQICEDIKKHIEEMDVVQRTNDGSRETRACLDSIRTVSENAKKLGNQSLEEHTVAASSSSSSSSSAPSVVDPKTYCAVPSDEKPCGRRLPCIAHSTEGNGKSNSSSEEPLAEKRKKKTELSAQEKRIIAHLQQLKLEYKNKLGGEGMFQETMSYSQAAKAVVQHYTFTSAYPKPLEEPSKGGGCGP